MSSYSLSVPSEPAQSSHITHLLFSTEPGPPTGQSLGGAQHRARDVPVPGAKPGKHRDNNLAAAAAAPPAQGRLCIPWSDSQHGCNPSQTCAGLPSPRADITEPGSPSSSQLISRMQHHSRNSPREPPLQHHQRPEVAQQHSECPALSPAPGLALWERSVLSTRARQPLEPAASPVKTQHLLFCSRYGNSESHQPSRLALVSIKN